MSDTFTAPANAPAQINRYGELCAEVYVLDKPPGALHDIQYYLEQLRPLDGPILEAACGSGRLLIPMLQAGLPVEGFDHSESMLAQCRLAADARGLNATLRRTRFQEFEYDRPFAAIVCPVGAFTLVDDYAEALAVLERFHDHLQPGGRLFVDIMPLAYLTNPASHHVRSWTTPAGEQLTITSSRLELDLLRQRKVTLDRYDRWRGGKLVESEVEVLATRLWALHEFELTLKEAGFEGITVCGDYRIGRPPRASDGWWCFQAVRAG
ncbi:MAG TPA: class I SAM-dependent methyltransferase [Caulobacteraceae bacterium]|nr:class I SAM-dependent methyltransferase [Caulobacteraceae bacterium]